MDSAAQQSEGRSETCPLCGTPIAVKPSAHPGGAACPQCGHQSWFSYENRGTVLVIRPKAVYLQPEDLDRLITGVPWTDGAQLVIDLIDVQFLSSAVLGRFINLKKALRDVRGKLSFQNLHPDLMQIFRITRLDQVLELGG